MPTARFVRWSPLLLICASCYGYVPASMEGVPSGSRVRARLTPAETVRVQDLLGSVDRTVEGELVEAEDDEVLLQVPIRTGRLDAAGGVLYQRIRIPREEVVAVELRRLDRLRTALLVAAGAAVAGFVVVQQFQGTGGQTDLPPGGGGPAEIVLPVCLPFLRVGGCP